jgi:hypothetical protein
LSPPTSAGGWLATAVLFFFAPRRSALLTAAALAGLSAARSFAVQHHANVPAALAVRTAARDELSGARRFIGTGARYTGLPLTAALSCRSRRARVLLAFGGLAMHVRDHQRLKPELSLGTFVGLRLLEEGALGAGLWTACVRDRSWRAFDPQLRLLPARGQNPLLSWGSRG